MFAIHSFLLSTCIRLRQTFKVLSNLKKQYKTLTACYATVTPRFYTVVYVGTSWNLCIVVGDAFTFRRSWDCQWRRNGLRTGRVGELEQTWPCKIRPSWLCVRFPGISWDRVEGNNNSLTSLLAAGRGCILCDVYIHLVLTEACRALYNTPSMFAVVMLLKTPANGTTAWCI